MDSVNNDFPGTLKKGFFTLSLATSYPSFRALISLFSNISVNIGALRWDVGFSISATTIVYTFEWVINFRDENSVLPARSRPSSDFCPQARCHYPNFRHLICYGLLKLASMRLELRAPVRIEPFIHTPSYTRTAFAHLCVPTVVQVHAHRR